MLFIQVGTPYHFANTGKMVKRNRTLRFYNLLNLCRLSKVYHGLIECHVGMLPNRSAHQFGSVSPAERRSMTELLNGYCIDQTSTTNFMLKKKYMGKRNGVEQECFKTVSHHTTWEDAAQAFVRLFRAEKTDTPIKNIEEYINAVKKANAEAVEAVQEKRMEHFFMYVPKGNGEKEEHSIVDLIPVGRNNAISRKSLLQLCVQNGLIESDKTYVSQDRRMRNMIEKARVNYTILNLSDGHGYYRPTKDDLQDLQRYIRQEEKRAKSTFKNLSMAKRLYEDYKAERII